jgi:RNA polymerase sigma-70 factor (ECF subfamily)
VDAFQTAARRGDFGALLAILDPDVVLRADLGVLGGGMESIRGAAPVAEQVATFRRTAAAAVTHPVLINGVAGLLTTIDGELISLMSFTVTGGKIAAVDVLSDPIRLSHFDLSDLAG